MGSREQDLKRQKEKMRTVPSLFVQFMKFGLFTFGGGWSIVAQMHRLYVEEQHLITGEDLVDMTSVGRSLPGTMIGNIAMLYGCRMAGYPGGLACVIGMVTPPMAVLAVITWFYSAFQQNVWVMAAMTGIRSAVVPIILTALAGMVKNSFRFPPCWAVAAASAILYLFLGVNCVILVLFGVICGLLISDYYERHSIPPKGAGQKEGGSRT